MAKKKSFLLRVDPALYEALQKWAADELRSVNGQIEYLLSRALAGVKNGTIIVLLPGSPAAVRLAMDKLLLPELGHLVKQAK